VALPALAALPLFDEEPLTAARVNIGRQRTSPSWQAEAGGKDPPGHYWHRPKARASKAVPLLTHYLKSLDLACIQPKSCDLAVGKAASKFDARVGD
jgi:hypothetical protein